MLTALILAASMQTPAAPPAATPAAPWAEEPTGYRGIPWNSPLADATKQIVHLSVCVCTASEEAEPKACRRKLEANDPQPLLRRCRSELDVAGVAVQDTLVFERDLLTGAVMQFSSDDFDKIRDVFLTKYGPPTRSSDSPVSNRMGATFTNHRLSWEGPKVSIALQRFGNTLDKGSAVLMLNDYAERRKAALEAKKQKGADSF